MQRIGLRTHLSHSIAYRDRNGGYTVSELLIALMYPMILGLEKIEVSSLLGSNGVFQYITGLPSFPNPTTLRRFLVRASTEIYPQLRAAHDQLLKHFLQRPMLPASYWIDCDSSSRTLYGHQEGALLGYNTSHPGKRSYHPLVVTEYNSGDCLIGKLRPGNVHTAEGIQDMVAHALEILPHRRYLRLRADAGFYSGKFIEFLGVNRIGYAVVAHIRNPLKQILAHKRYTPINATFSTTEFRYQPHGWPQAERFVALRRKLPEDPQEERTTLFTFDRYAYSVIVTNLDFSPWGVFQFYKDRAAIERIIRTLKEDFPFGSAPTKNFGANLLYAELSLLAYNIITWFKRLCLPPEWQQYILPTIRHKLLMIPGEFVRTGNVPTLRFPKNSLYQDVYAYAEKSIKKIQPIA